MTDGCGQDRSAAERARDPTFLASALILTLALILLLWVGIRAVNVSHYDVYILGYEQPAVIVGGLLLFGALYIQQPISLASALVVSLATGILLWISVQAINISHYNIYILGYGPVAVVAGGVVLSAVLYTRSIE